jgi:hypothetical protein
MDFNIRQLDGSLVKYTLSSKTFYKCAGCGIEKETKYERDGVKFCANCNPWMCAKYGCGKPSDKYNHEWNSYFCSYECLKKWRGD